MKSKSVVLSWRLLPSNIFLQKIWATAEGRGIARTTNHCWTWYDNQAGNTGRSKTHWSVQFTKCYNEWLLRVSLCCIGLVVVYLLVTTNRQSMGKETFVRLPVFDGLCLVPHCQYGHVGTHYYGLWSISIISPIMSYASLSTWSCGDSLLWHDQYYDQWMSKVSLSPINVLCCVLL